MGIALLHRIKQKSFSSPQHEATLNVIVTGDYLRQQVERACADFDITPIQFNVLRILMGARPEGHPRCEIISRLIERGTDVTRLIDRLENRGLVERARDGEDRRHSHTRITQAGVELLEKINPILDVQQFEQMRRLTDEECLELSRLCEKIYAVE